MTMGIPFRHILVTGGLGFIGSTLSERLLSSGLAVTILDNETSNVIEGSDLTGRFPNATYLFADISRDTALLGCGTRFDLVIHAASYVGAAGILPHSGSMASNMLNATANVIKICLASDAPLCYFSSSEIYGKSGILLENSEIRVPPYFNARIEYALGKLTGEAMIYNSRDRGLRALTIRPFNVVGPRQSRASGFVLPTFVQQAIERKPLTVFDSGLQKRSFLSVDDLADLVEKCIAQRRFDAFTVNAGNPRNTVTINFLAQRVNALLGSHSVIENVNAQSIHGPRYYEAESFEKICNIDAAQSLGWKPDRDLDQIILDTAEYFYANCRKTAVDAVY